MNKYAVSELLNMMEQELDNREQSYRDYHISKGVGTDFERHFRFGELRGQMDGFESAIFMVRSFFEALERQSR